MPTSGCATCARCTRRSSIAERADADDRKPAPDRRGRRGRADARRNRSIRRDHHRRSAAGRRFRHGTAEHRPGRHPRGRPIQPRQRPVRVGRRLGAPSGQPGGPTSSMSSWSRTRVFPRYGRPRSTWPAQPVARGWSPMCTPRSAMPVGPSSLRTVDSTGWPCARLRRAALVCTVSNVGTATMRRFAGPDPCRDGRQRGRDRRLRPRLAADRVPATMLFVGVICRRKGTLELARAARLLRERGVDGLATRRGRRTGPDPGAEYAEIVAEFADGRPRRRPGRA